MNLLIFNYLKFVFNNKIINIFYWYFIKEIFKRKLAYLVLDSLVTLPFIFSVCCSLTVRHVCVNVWQNKRKRKKSTWITNTYAENRSNANFFLQCENIFHKWRNWETEQKNKQTICNGKTITCAEKVAARLCNSIFSVCVYLPLCVCACTCDVRATKRNAREMSIERAAQRTSADNMATPQ